MDAKKPENGAEESKHCGRHGCGCGYKVIGALVLILLGWVCGFLMGSGGHCRKSSGMCCSSSAMSCPMSEMEEHEHKAAPAPK